MGRRRSAVHSTKSPNSYSRKYGVRRPSRELAEEPELVVEESLPEPEPEPVVEQQPEPEPVVEPEKEAPDEPVYPGSRKKPVEKAVKKVDSES